MTNYFRYEVKTAPLASDFGRDYAMRVFKMTEDELAKACGRYVRGSKKGLLKGFLKWGKITKGGWVKTGPYDFEREEACGFIVAPGVKFGHCVTLWDSVPIGQDFEAPDCYKPIADFIAESEGHITRAQKEQLRGAAHNFWNAYREASEILDTVQEVNPDCPMDKFEILAKAAKESLAARIDQCRSDAFRAGFKEADLMAKVEELRVEHAR